MIRFCQPSDSVHKGRVIWVRPEEVMLIERADRCDQCCITLRNGDVFFLAVEGEEAANRIRLPMGGRETRSTASPPKRPKWRGDGENQPLQKMQQFKLINRWRHGAHGDPATGSSLCLPHGTPTGGFKKSLLTRMP